MKKLNPVIYNKFLIQAEEAKNRGMEKLASHVFNTIGSLPEDEEVKYSYSELQDDMQGELWKAATHALKYYDIKSAEVEKLNEIIEVCASNFIEQLEKMFEVETVGPLEEKVPGEI